MSGCVIELRDDALKSDSDILRLLRITFTIARKLDLSELEKWAVKELKGYDIDDDIPAYRQVVGYIVIPIDHQRWNKVLVEGGDKYTRPELRESIPSLLEYKKSNNDIFIKAFDNKTCENLQRIWGLGNYVFGLEVSTSYIENIIETVRTIILDWALLLEEKGIKGENLSFSKEDKERISTDESVTNFIINIYGNVDNTQIQQGTNKSSQERF